VQAWANGEPNFGWGLIPLGGDGWRWNPSEYTDPARRPKLTVLYFIPPPEPVVIVTAPAAQNVTEGQPFSFTVTVTGTLPTYQWSFSTSPTGPFVDIGGATGRTYAKSSAVAGDAGYYRVTVANNYPSSAQATAQLTVAIDTTPPQLTLAVARMSLFTNQFTITNVIVAFSEQLEVASAENLGNYLLTLVGGAVVTPASARAVNTTTNCLVTKVTRQLVAVVTPASARAVNTTTNCLVTLVTPPLFPNAQYSLRVSGVADFGPRHNVIVTTNVLVAADVFLLDDTAAYGNWNYKPVPVNVYDNSVPPVLIAQTNVEAQTCLDGTGWMNPGYVMDGSWGSGPTLFFAKTGALPGSSDIPVGTFMAVTNAAGTRNITYYFRKQFSYPYPADALQLRVRPIIDDGAAFYINGAQALRLRMTTTADILCSTLASGAPPSNTEPRYDTGSPFTLTNWTALGPDNTIAVEVHQESITSSDVEMACQLIATVPGSALPIFVQKPTLSITKDPNTGVCTITWTAAPGFILESASVITGPWTQLPSATSPYAIPSLAGRTFYRMVKPGTP